MLKISQKLRNSYKSGNLLKYKNTVRLPLNSRQTLEK